MEPVCYFKFLNLLKYFFFFFSFLVDFTEFMLAIALTQSGDLDERLALAFDMYDYNNSGTSKLNIKIKEIFYSFFFSFC